MVLTPVHRGTDREFATPGLPNILPPLSLQRLYNLDMTSHYTTGGQELKVNSRARFTGGLPDSLTSFQKTGPASRRRSVVTDAEIVNSIPHSFSTIPNLPNSNLPTHDPPRPPLPPNAPSQPPRGPDSSNTQDSSGSPDRSRNPQPRPRPRNSRNSVESSHLFTGYAENA